MFATAGEARPGRLRWATMNQGSVERWIGLLAEAMRNGIEAAGPAHDPHVALARGLLATGGSPSAGTAPPPVDDRRPDVAGLLACARVLAWPGDPQRPLPAEAHPMTDLARWLVARPHPPGAPPPPGIARLIRGQTGGAFATASPDGQPDTWWYGELVSLHAVTSYALFAGDEAAWRASRAGAAFVHAEIQPDHATALPWGLAGLVLAPGCQTTAEWMLNACMIQYGGAPRGVGLVILADALYGLRHVQRADLNAGRAGEPVR